MSLRQAFRMAWESIAGNKMRSFLTMLGMIIGVASVIALVSLMQGMIDYSQDSFNDMGTNLITVTLPNRTDNKRVSVDEMYQFIDKNPDLFNSVTPTVNAMFPLRHGKEIKENKQVSGVGESYASMNNREVEFGRFLDFSDVVNRSKVCVIGTYIEDAMFTEKDVLGQSLKIGNDTYTVIGVLKEKLDSTENSADDCIYIPYTTAGKASFTGYITNYSVEAKTTELATKAQKKLEEFLYSRFHDEDLYSVFSLAEMLKMVQQMQNTMKMVLVGIAGISLLVAGIGIMNIMLVSVTERTKEIGIRKSLGAKKKDIMNQFVIEAGMVSSIGGAIGILIGGVATAKLGDVIGINTTPSLSAIGLAFGVSFFIGIIFGYLPANKAANLNPIDALRNE